MWVLQKTPSLLSRRMKGGASFLFRRRDGTGRRTAGVTLLEIVITLGILLILAAVAQPMTRHFVRRTREADLKQRLSQIRSAIDDFHRDWERDGSRFIGPYCQKAKTTCRKIAGEDGYPRAMEHILTVEFVDETPVKAPVKTATSLPNDPGDSDDLDDSDDLGDGEEEEPVKERRVYLRKIPIDPITKTDNWGFRCYEDPPDSTTWCGKDIYDVYSRSAAMGRNGIPYNRW